MKHVSLQWLLFLVSLLPAAGRAQNTLFSENMGTAGAGGNPAITGFTGFQNSGCSYAYSGTGDVRNTSPSPGSGVNNVFLATNRTFIISGLNTLGYSSIGMSYNIFSSSIVSGSAGFIIEASTNGVNYTVVPHPTTVFVLGGWASEAISGTLPAAQDLSLRFTNTVNGLDYRVDDIVITGIPTASTNPAAAYNGWPASYTFNNWPASSAAGSYPANMVFHHAALGVAQPVINDVVASYNYANSYSISASNTCLSFISGRGSNGISFVDRNPGSASGTGNLGEAVLSVNTTCRRNVQVAWTAGTQAVNGTVYQVRAQYRIGNSGAYTNLPMPNSNIADIRYTSNTPVTNYGPITLPATCENVPLVQIRWAYYWAGAGSGTGDEIYLTNINVSSSAYPGISGFSNQSICGSKSTAAVSFSSAPAGASISWTNSNTNIGLAASGSGNIAAYTTPTVASDQTGLITVSAALNSCTNTASFSITVKGPQLATVWNGSVSNDWFEHNNWSNCVCSSITSATIPAVPSQPLISGSTVANVNNLLINAGASLFMQNTQTLSVRGSWTNNGNFSPVRGTVQLSGSSAQSLGGTGTGAFYNLTLGNSSGASLSTTQRIAGSLQLNAGTLSTNNLLTLTADATGTGKIGPISASADIIGNVTIQQFAAGGTTGWTQLGTPITSALTMADWNDNFAITCASCPDGPMGGFTSIYSYDETIAGSYSVAAKYIPITSITENISHIKGYWVYLGNGLPSTTDITFDVTGTVAKSNCLSCSGSITIPVTKTANTSTFDDGWNLLSNPLPSPISWTALRNSNSNVDNALYVYNPDLAGGLGAYATYINGISSTTVGGISDTIPICQGFYVHATASTILTAGENIKLNGNPALLRTSAVTPVARLVMTGSAAFSDMATFYFGSGGTASFQTDYDAYKLIFDESTPYIGSLSDSILTSISGLPNLGSALSVPVKAITPASDNFCFSLLTSDFPENSCVILHDSFTNTDTDLLSTPYCCQLYDTTSMARFSISFYCSNASVLSSSLNGIEPQRGAASYYRLSSAQSGVYRLFAQFETARALNTRLFDISGKELQRCSYEAAKEKHLEIDLSSFAPGVYYLAVEANGRPEKTFKLLR